MRLQLTSVCGMLLAAMLIATLRPAVGLQADEGAVAPAASEPTAATPAAEAAQPAAAAPPAAPVVPPPPPPIDQQPYRVLVAIAVAPDVGFDARYREEVLAGLRQRIDSRLGELWQADVQLADWLSPGRRTVLTAFTEADLNARYLPLDYDKVFFATLERDGSAVRTSALEWDRNSQTSTAVTSSLGYEPRVAIDRLFAEILTHFRPIAAIESVSEDGNTVELRVRGGEFIPPDRSVQPFEAGVYFRPYYRYLDRKKQLRQLQPMPWTYVEVNGVERGRMQGAVQSAFRGALAGNRRRTELMAIAVKPRFAESLVRIYPRGQQDNPLSATRVDVLDRHPTDDDPVDDRTTMYTDRFGTVAIPANPERPLQQLYVMSGKNVLATVPFIPGDLPRAELDVPDDGPRLAVEGEVSLLEAELIEVVARREVTIQRALGQARAGKWETADVLINEVKNLPTREVLKERLERIRLPAIAAVRQAKNRVAESRINKLCKQLEEHINQHLQPDRVAAFQTEIRELKEANKPGS